MVVTDAFGCKDTFTHYNMFTIHDVKADFQLTNVAGCDSMIVDSTSSHSDSIVFPTNSSTSYRESVFLASILSKPHHWTVRLA